MARSGPGRPGETFRPPGSWTRRGRH
jgi:hypothetical protein